MSQWMQCDFIQTTIVWADAACSISPDTHDGVDEAEVRKRVRSDEKAFKSARERLREALTLAWDGPPGEIAAEVRALASPFVDVLESGALRVDYEAMEARSAAVMRDVLEMEAALRAEYRAAREEEDDEDVVLLTWS